MNEADFEVLLVAIKHPEIAHLLTDAISDEGKEQMSGMFEKFNAILEGKDE